MDEPKQLGSTITCLAANLQIAIDGLKDARDVLRRTALYLEMHPSVTEALQAEFGDRWRAVLNDYLLQFEDATNDPLS